MDQHRHFLFHQLQLELNEQVLSEAPLIVPSSSAVTAELVTPPMMHDFLTGIVGFYEDVSLLLHDLQTQESSAVSELLAHFLAQYKPFFTTNVWNEAKLATFGAKQTSVRQDQIKKQKNLDFHEK